MSAYVGALRAIGWGAVVGVLLFATLAMSNPASCPATSAHRCVDVTTGPPS